MALLNVSTESAHTEAGKSVLTASIFYKLAANFGFCSCVHNVTKHGKLTRLSTEIQRLHVSRES